MTKNTKVLLGVAAVAAVGYYFWNKSKKPTVGFATANGRLVASSIPSFNATGEMGASGFFKPRQAMGGKFQATGRKKNANGRKLRPFMKGTKGFAA